jgi:hypothetical protein
MNSSAEDIRLAMLAYERFRESRSPGYRLPAALATDRGLWNKVAKKARSIGAEPDLFVEVQFQTWNGPFPYPNQLFSDYAVNNFLKWHGETSSGSKNFLRERTKSTNVVQFEGRIEDLKRLVALSERDAVSTILDPGFPSDPLFRALMIPGRIEWGTREADLAIAREKIKQDRFLRDYLENHDDSTIRTKVQEILR